MNKIGCNISKLIQASIIGMGAMGKGLLYQFTHTPGFRCLAIADIHLSKAVDCAKWSEVDYKIVNNLNDLNDTIRKGILAVTDNCILLSESEYADVLIEASSAIEDALRYSICAIENGKHLVLMNAEIDLIFGPYLAKLADDHHVVYSSCDGDQHGIIKQLADKIDFWGFELVMAGNIKGFLDRYSNPVKIIPEADKRNLDYKMAAAMTDGTKLSIEMALVANAMGLETKTPGMYGPRVKQVSDVFSCFNFNEIWSNRIAAVDYILGSEPGGGVFVVGYCDHPYQKEMMKYYKMGEGPFYLFYRPYHLCHVEALEWIAEACIHHKSLLRPNYGFRTNVFAYAKTGLKKGQTLDGLGGFTCYGLIDNYEVNGHNPGLPICLADHVTLKSDIKADHKILLSDIDYDPDRLDFETYFAALAVK